MNRQKIVKWLRIIHRDLGFLMVGITIVYALSGMVVNHIGKHDPAFKTEEGILELPVGMDDAAIAEQLAEHDLPDMKRTAPLDSEHIQVYLQGGVAVYNKINGNFEYETFQKRPFIYWINRLHYNKVGGWSIMGDLFATSLIFFAVSGLFLVRGKNGIAGRGKWYLIIGILIPIIYVMLA